MSCCQFTIQLRMQTSTYHFVHYDIFFIHGQKEFHKFFQLVPDGEGRNCCRSIFVLLFEELFNAMYLAASGICKTLDVWIIGISKRRCWSGKGAVKK